MDGERIVNGAGDAFDRAAGAASAAPATAVELSIVAPAHNVLDVGDLDPVNAAAAGLTFLTAWRMLSTPPG